MKRKQYIELWPTFDASLLQEIATAFLGRRKAIAYRSGLFCGREFDSSQIVHVERLNIEAGSLRLSIWADGVMWLAVCVKGLGRGAGWAFKDSFHGEVLAVPAKSLVEMVMATLNLPFGKNPEKEWQELRAIWEKVQPYTGH